MTALTIDDVIARVAAFMAAHGGQLPTALEMTAEQRTDLFASVGIGTGHLLDPHEHPGRVCDVRIVIRSPAFRGRPIDSALTFWREAE